MIPYLCGGNMFKSWKLDNLLHLTEHQLDPACIVCQGYDGVSVMSGSWTAAIERDISMYCAMHTNCIKSIQFNLLVIFSVCMRLCMYSPTVFAAKQKEVHPEKQVHQLWYTLGMATRGVVICCTYDSVIANSEEVSGAADQTKAVGATGLLLQIKNLSFFSYTLCLIRYRPVSRVCLTTYLQHAQVNLVRGVDLRSFSNSVNFFVLMRRGQVIPLCRACSWGQAYRCCELIANLTSL